MIKRTKIVCTLGPASESPKMLEQMVGAGMDVARLNLSHGTHESHAKLVGNIKSARKKFNIPLPIMWDVQGPKIRVSTMVKPVEIFAKQKIVIGKDFFMDFDVSGDVKKGHRVMIEDGLLELVVDKVIKSQIYCTVLNGGLVKQHKSMNFPDTRMTMPIMTEKDMEDCKFGLTLDVDYVALSFVRNTEDIKNWKKFIQKHNPKEFALPQTIIKLELPSAVEDFDNILKEVDIVMVARGDLGVEIPASQVPVVQKTIIRKCVQAAKPVIVATQMLESMIQNPRATRAEVSDVANAVIDRTDAVMLSGETAFGKYPLEAVRVMNSTILDVEGSEYMGERCLFDGDMEGQRTASIAASACELSRGAKADAIISVTDSGFTARFLSHQRPWPPVYVLTDKPKVYKQMALMWGIVPLLVKRYKNVLDLLEHAMTEVKKAGFLKKGDKAVIVAPHSIGERVNMVMVNTVK